MKREINLLKTIALGFVLSIMGTACADKPLEASESLNSTSIVQSSEMTTTMITTSTTGESIEITAMSNKEVVEAILIDTNDFTYSCDGTIDFVNSTMEYANELSGKPFGEITSEEDAKKKAEEAWIEIDEKCFGAHNDNLDYYQPFITKYYEEYDVWMITGSLPPSSTDEDGNRYAVLGTVPCIIMRRSNGTVLATWIR